MRALKNILVSGGSGFIGCNFIRFLLGPRSVFTGRVVNLDALTYAGSTASLADIVEQYSGSRYHFEKGDITDRPLVESLFQKYVIDIASRKLVKGRIRRNLSE
jgi:dTDP-glucose 4,6-dehydratase